MMHIDIIKANTDNAADILKIENACFSTPWSERSILEALRNPNSYFYIALQDGKTAGYMGLQIFSGEGYVTNVATLPEFRKKGVASALLKSAMKNKMAFITLEVRESNYPAIFLYQSLGFKEAGRRPRFYREPTEDAIIMTKYFEK